ncbi:unnamed protein product [Brassica oleracea var. botrytis]
MPLTSRVSTLSMSLNWDQNRSETLESIRSIKIQVPSFVSSGRNR